MIDPREGLDNDDAGREYERDECDRQTPEQRARAALPRRTLTAGRLRELLAECPEDAPAFAWRGHGYEPLTEEPDLLRMVLDDADGWEDIEADARYPDAGLPEIDAVVI